MAGPAQQPGPPQQPQQGGYQAPGEFPPGFGQQPSDPRTQAERQADAVLEQILGGELPGAGYLFADTPEKRQANLIKTTPDEAREALLRAVESVAQDALLPYGMVTKSELGKAALAFSQAYLLLDPTVDEAGVPIAASAEAEQAAKEGAAHASAEGQAHVARVKTAAEAGHMQDPETFTRAPATGGHQEPPRVQPNAAELAIQEANKPKEDVLRGARADRPRPKPRVGE